MIICGMVSVYHGTDAHWDLKNYHIYNPFAAINNRYTIDVAPAQLQTYLNPILDYPFYFAIKLFNDHPRTIAFAMGLVQGINLWLVAMISWHCIRESGEPSVVTQISLTVIALVIGDNAILNSSSLRLAGSVRVNKEVAVRRTVIKS